MAEPRSETESRDQIGVLGNFLNEQLPWMPEPLDNYSRHWIARKNDKSLTSPESFLLEIVGILSLYPAIRILTGGMAIQFMEDNHSAHQVDFLGFACLEIHKNSMTIGWFLTSTPTQQNNPCTKGHHWEIHLWLMNIQNVCRFWMSRDTTLKNPDVTCFSKDTKQHLDVENT